MEKICHKHTHINIIIYTLHEFIINILYRCGEFLCGKGSPQSSINTIAFNYGVEVWMYTEQSNTIINNTSLSYTYTTINMNKKASTENGVNIKCRWTSIKHCICLSLLYILLSIGMHYIHTYVQYILQYKGCLFVYRNRFNGAHRHHTGKTYGNICLLIRFFQYIYFVLLAFSFGSICLCYVVLVEW